MFVCQCKKTKEMSFVAVSDVTWPSIPCKHRLKFRTTNPDKPGLKIDPPAAERLKICGIAPGLRSLFGGVGSLCLFNLPISDFRPKRRAAHGDMSRSWGEALRI